MCSGSKFYLCKICGNLAGKIHDSGIDMICCGQPMTELVANTTEASVEKHIPDVAVSGDLVSVVVGSTPHPMTAEHHITWVYLQTENGGQRKCLQIDSEPKAEFALKGDKAVAVFAYCNLHGLWKADIK